MTPCGDKTQSNSNISLRKRDEMTDHRSIKAIDDKELEGIPLTLAHRLYNDVIQDSTASCHFSYFANSDDVIRLQKLINYQFKDHEILTRAFTHSSFVHEFKDNLKSYERLEFLGDSIVGTFVSQKLFESFDTFSEGKLSKLKSALVNEEALSELAKFLKLDTLVLRGKGELKEELTNSLLCDVLESLIGAVSVDSSIEKAFEVFETIINQYESQTKSVFFTEKRLQMFDPKSTLQEFTMKNFGTLPKYVANRVDDFFVVELWIEGNK